MEMERETERMESRVEKERRESRKRRGKNRNRKEMGGARPQNASTRICATYARSILWARTPNPGIATLTFRLEEGTREERQPDSQLPRPVKHNRNCIVCLP